MAKNYISKALFLYKVVDCIYSLIIVNFNITNICFKFVVFPIITLCLTWRFFSSVIIYGNSQTKRNY